MNEVSERPGTDHDSSVLNNEPGVPVAPSVEKLLLAVAPFVRFHNGGEAWKHSAWAGKDDNCQVLYDHRTGNQITLGDFYDLAAAARKLLMPQREPVSRPTSPNTDESKT